MDGFPASVSDSNKRKLMAAATALTAGRFPAVDVLGSFYGTYFKPGGDEVFGSERFLNVSIRRATCNG